VDVFNPLVSIVIPVYNGSDYLKHAIDSALAQKYENCEVLVINDGSTDEGKTESIALAYGDKIRYFSKENGGVATALNFGVEKMQGEYFSWLSHDDVYLPNKISGQIKILAGLKDKQTVLFGGFQVIDENGEYQFELDPIGDKQYTQEQMSTPLFALFRVVVHGCSLLLHKNHFGRIGLFDKTLPTTQDYEFFFRLMRNQNVYFHSDLFLQVRRHKNQGIRNLSVSQQEEEDKTWFDMFSALTKQERIAISENEYRFYYEFFNTPHFQRTHMKNTREYLRASLVKQVPMLDGNNDLLYFREFSRFVSELSDEYERKAYGAYQDFMLYKSTVSGSSTGLKVRIARPMFHLLRRTAEVLRVKERLKGTKLYRRLFVRGVIDKLQ